eukprot:3021965-Amphidinium_carterae.1
MVLDWPRGGAPSDDALHVFTLSRDCQSGPAHVLLKNGEAQAPAQMWSTGSENIHAEQEPCSSAKWGSLGGLPHEGPYAHRVLSTLLTGRRVIYLKYCNNEMCALRSSARLWPRFSCLHELQYDKHTQATT